MIFLFPRWDMLIPWRVYLFKIYDLFIIACFSLPLGACNWSTSPCVFPGREARPGPTESNQWDEASNDDSAVAPAPPLGLNPCIINRLFSRISCTEFQHFTCPKNSRRAKLKKYAKMQMYLFSNEKNPRYKNPWTIFPVFDGKKPCTLTRGAKKGGVKWSQLQRCDDRKAAG